MKNEIIHVVKCDVNADASIEIMTHRVAYKYSHTSYQYITCKNLKPIGWTLTEEHSLLMHDLFVRKQILREEEEDYSEFTNQMRSRSSEEIEKSSRKMHV